MFIWIKNHFMNCSLYQKILILDSIIIIFPLLLMILFTYSKISNISKQEFYQYSQDTVNQINNNITSYLTEMDLQAYMIAQNSEVQKALNFPSNGYELKKANQKIAVMNFINTLLNISIENNSLTIYGLNGELFYKGNSVLNYSYHFAQNPYLQLLKKQDNSRLFIPPHHVEFIMDQTSLFVTILRGIYNPDSEKLIGYIFLDIHDHVLNHLTGNDNPNEKNMIVMASGKNIIYINAKTPINAVNAMELSQILTEKKQTGMIKLHNKANYFYTSSFMDLTGWKVIALNSVASYYAKIRTILNFILIVALACIIMSFLVAAMISSGITKPVQKLASLMQQVERDNFDIQFPVKYHDEISLLGQFFNHMVVRIKNLITSVYQSQLAEKEALILALQSQINPHFLYNTLQSISDQALQEGSENAAEMSRSLSKMFRYAVDNSQRIVRLYDEVEHCRNYLFIQFIRYDNQFQVVWNIPEELLRLKVPKLILQPLIENAIQHGIYSKMAQGKIGIKAEKLNQTLILSVTDNGVGIPTEKITEIQQEIHSHTYNSKDVEIKYLALNNINKRLSLQYGADYALQIESIFMQKTTVTIKIPLKDNDNSKLDNKEQSFNV